MKEPVAENAEPINLSEALRLLQKFGPIGEGLLRSLLVESGMLLNREMPNMLDSTRLSFSKMIDNGVAYLSVVFTPGSTLEEFEAVCHEVRLTHVAAGGAPPAKLMARVREIMRSVIGRHLDGGDEASAVKDALAVILAHAHARIFSPPAKG